jgi:hypothetical protein
MTGWERYDVPRLWLATRGEGTATGWSQVAAWQTLADHQATAVAALRSTRAHLERAWPPEESGVAAGVLARFDELIAAAEELAAAAAANTDALHRVVGVLVEARSDLDEVQAAWERVTSEWQPEWWDGMASRLNGDARERMARSDTAVAQHARSFVIPGSPARPEPPTTIAHDQVETEPSVLPLPPGHPLAGAGGIYHLPNGTGDGWIQANPLPAAATQQTSTEPKKQQRAVRHSRRGKADCEWEVATGVPAVIGPRPPSGE